MNKSAFLKLIQQVSNISDQQTEELERVAATFPYCQTAHLLLAKSAYDKGSMLSTQRLRRASSYATDRQLLKRLIYTIPEPEIEEEEVATGIEADVDIVATTEAAEIEATAVESVTSEPLAEENLTAENLDEVYPSAIPIEVDPIPELEATEEQETVEEQLDSELALLFTFNSISTSSTDLLSTRNQPQEELTDEPDQESPDHFQEAAEALTEINEAEPKELVAIPEEELTMDVLEESPAGIAESPKEEIEIFEEEEEITQPAAPPEDAVINYSTDEIDRLYAEDALGYWMGSSRMGEVLQLKDDYTRQRPQSFHPELILEYSKTHELEKAIQPTDHVLSNQLDIIDQFLKLNPRLKTMANLKLKPEPQEDLSLKSSKIKKGMASESLANIFLKQGKPKKALKIYEQLILKYPEKKSYFAEQIEKLQNIT
ncbi:hypothetical protein H9Q13_03720 [Pontibacter sp. JH31]|uniref:Tetratricopeptide repeat protein n=1 Tax=Pontibacter aquaedesilientis TaxID=2766980 RepID=A0ABR7XD98_9BACT|nr:hypothetical protein [Pontibacter aquaedesilientis]MBD1396264.1 hypothetical protein [Pontibacter aquaedesilientis]